MTEVWLLWHWQPHLRWKQRFHLCIVDMTQIQNDWSGNDGSCFVEVLVVWVGYHNILSSDKVSSAQANVFIGIVWSSFDRKNSMKSRVGNVNFHWSCELSYHARKSPLLTCLMGLLRPATLDLELPQDQNGWGLVHAVLKIMIAKRN